MKSGPETQIDRSRTSGENIARWRNRVMRRMRARHDRRPVWDRRQFLEEFWDDHPQDRRAVELADAFEAAIDAAHGNPRRFERELERLLG